MALPSLEEPHQAPEKTRWVAARSSRMFLDHDVIRLNHIMV